ncbi:uncharacterized protein E0L32_009723 [Thyridium curvatum]|uniref:MMS19 nucleotide excision repair protein n=1 Tax=Thyridium curvatum TaxID=1093900 RepID=A0A507AMB0_9PEZI|nr:uncharacterized protein E0L32_009723 [Thyridium curvatum]TPX08783.1 hypothetical protein E0L32_009723 [Thyridium curvatum]
MADFKSWATQYVVSDSDSEMRDLTVKAATAIQDAPRKTTAVLLWAQSINQWIAGGADDEGGDDDVIARSKALEFLSGTLEALDRDVLRLEQVQTLISFFGSMFNVDHKAGILAASKALRCLSTAKAFKPIMSIAIFNSLCSLGEDFSKQTAATRSEIYGLLDRLLADDAVRSELQREYGGESRFMIDLLELCHQEKDPKNLLSWFGILALFLETYEPSVDVAQEVFKAYSNYFPISMRSSATTTGVTVEDLKTAVRKCFAASHRASDSAFKFLLERLDSGDAITVAVKVDILKTIKACIDSYPDPVRTIVPYTEKIWSSLKYEVRNGEIEETIKGTLDVIRGIAKKLDGVSGEAIGVEPLKAFVQLVLGDCIEDLSNPIYTKQAGILLTNVLGASIKAFNLSIQQVLEAIKRNIRQPKSPNHRRDLVALLNVVLQERSELVKGQGAESSPDVEEFHAYDPLVKDLLNDVYYRLWKENSAQGQEKGSTSILKEVLKGLTAMIGQHGPSRTEMKASLLDEESCNKIYSTTTSQLIRSPSKLPEEAMVSELAPQAVRSLQKQTLVYPEGFRSLLAAARVAMNDPSVQTAAGSEVRAHDLKSAWAGASKAELIWLKELLSRLAYIGCSEIPTAAPPISQLLDFVGLLWELLQIFLDADLDHCANIVLSGIYGGLLNFREACIKKGLETNGSSFASISLLIHASLPRTAEEFQKGWASFSGDTTQNESSIFRDYLLSGLYTLSLLYRKASEANRMNVGQLDTFLLQLSNMATYIIRDLSLEDQLGMQLQSRALDLFSLQAPSSTLFRPQESGNLDALTMGVMQGLWPAAATKIWCQDLAPVNVFDDVQAGASGTSANDLSPRQRFVRDCIAVTVANKYLVGAGAKEEDELKWKMAIDFVKDQLSEDKITNLTPAQYSRLLAFAAGAVARMDREIRAVVPLLSKAPARNAAYSEEMARSVEVLVSPKDYLNTDNHAIIKPLHKQWLYASFAKPMIPLAFPFKQDGAQSTAYTISIISLLKHIPFAVYEDDVDSLARILIAALSALAGNWRDVEGALLVLIDVLDNKADALREHLKAVIDAVRKIFAEASAPGTPLAAAACRRQALVLLSGLPPRYEVRHLLAYAPMMQRMLAMACGDRVREVRAAAQVAREAWQKID